MGQAIARLLLNNHYDVTVWNRTVSRAEEMAELGARKCGTISELLQDNKTVILSLTDLQLMFQLLDSETPLMEGLTLVNLSSDTPENARKANEWALKHGASYRNTSAKTRARHRCFPLRC